MDFASFFKNEENEKYYQDLMKFLKNEYQTKVIYPRFEDVFNAFKYCDVEKIKVVIIGQDPYFNENQAHGLAFSVNHGVEIPKSLLNIYKELEDDLGYSAPIDGNLENWAKQGVFLLNRILTVEKGKPLSHKGKGWEIFTCKVIQLLNESSSPKVFVLWGKEAQGLKSLITNDKHLIIESSHPSPLAAYRGFFGSKVFSRINDFLSLNNLETIDFS